MSDGTDTGVKVPATSVAAQEDESPFAEVTRGRTDTGVKVPATSVAAQQDESPFAEVTTGTEANEEAKGTGSSKTKKKNKNKNKNKGKNNKNKRKNSHQGNNTNSDHPAKRRNKRVGQFWIQSCRGKEPSDPKILNNAIYLIISRVELTDDLLGGNGVKVKTDEKEERDTENIKAVINGDSDALLKVKSAERKVNGEPNDEKLDIESQEDIKVLNVEESQKIEIAENAESAKGTTEDVTPVKTASIETEKPLEEVEGEEKQEAHNNDTPFALPTLEGNESRKRPFVYVQVASSAKGKMQGFHGRSTVYKELSNGNCGDGICNPHPNDVVPNKYWAQRRRLFSKYDDGIHMDAASWYSVTPEVIAQHIATKLCTNMVQQRQKDSTNQVSNTENANEQKELNADSPLCDENTKSSTKSSRGFVVLDVFCGCGGNAIAFAQQEAIDLVVCIDIDGDKLQMLANNAKIYGIPSSKILLIQGDGIAVMRDYYSNGKLRYCNPVTDKETETEKDRKQDISKGSDETLSHGFRMGGMEQLPSCIDAIFLSPPWGGPQYSSFGDSVSLVDCVQLTSASSPLAETVRTSTDDAKTAPINAMIDGEEMLRYASSATNDGQHVIAFLPKNINGLSVGHAASTYTGRHALRGNRILELEQNVVNGKLKTVTAYLGQGRIADEIV
jgi:trimethylguanosine synthase